MSDRITRRSLAALVAAAAASTAQNPPASTPATPDEELAAARTAAKAWNDQIAKIELSRAVEPAAHFKA